MRKNIHEVFEYVDMNETTQDKVEVLRNYANVPGLKDVLMGAFHPGIQYSVDQIPEYKKDDVPIGFGYTHIAEEIGRVYLFMKNHPKTPPTLTDKRRKELLVQTLEALEPKEAEIYAGMLMKKLPVDLTYEQVKLAFPEILPDKPVEESNQNTGVAK